MKKIYAGKLIALLLAAALALLLPADGERAEAREAEQMAAALPVLMDNTSGLYGSLSQFLQLSAENFQIYTVAVIDPVTQQPVQPDAPVPVAVGAPDGYDTARTLVSEITMNGQTPVRTEIAFTYNNGQIIFETDHSGIYAVMEKKIQPQLPGVLEMTQKVEKLELTSKYPSGVPANSKNTLSVQPSPPAETTVPGALEPSPRTGDYNFPVILESAVVMGAAAAVLAGLKMREKKTAGKS